MSKSYYSLGLMSGTSGDGVDASIIKSDGDTKYEVILDKYYKYPDEIHEKFHNLKESISSVEDLLHFKKKLLFLEAEITFFHKDLVNEIIKNSEIDIDLIGFHGQTILHIPEKKISKQLGDGKLLSQLTNKIVVYDFRQNDLKNGGQGAPLTPVFHQMMEKKINIKPVSFLNIGGILNRTTIWDDGKLSASDIGPGMCLIDKWIRINSKKKYDDNGDIAKSGKIHKIIVDQALEKFFQNISYDQNSFDTSDFDISFVKGLSLEDGAATLTEYTAQIILSLFKANLTLNIKEKSILCGGGRKNKFLVDRIKAHKTEIKLIDDYGIDGDFVESQAFAYLAIRSYLKLPISFPDTTGCSKTCTGGVIIGNY